MLCCLFESSDPFDTSGCDKRGMFPSLFILEFISSSFCTLDLEDNVSREDIDPSWVTGLFKMLSIPCGLHIVVTAVFGSTKGAFFMALIASDVDKLKSLFIVGPLSAFATNVEPI